MDELLNIIQTCQEIEKKLDVVAHYIELLHLSEDPTPVLEGVGYLLNESVQSLSTQRERLGELLAA